MDKRLLVALVVANCVLSLAGCSGNKTASTGPNTAPKTNNTDPGARNPEPAPSKETPTSPDPEPSKPEPASKVSGWSGKGEDPIQIAGRVDKMLKSLTTVEAETRIVSDAIGGNRLTVKAITQIQNAKTFEIQYPAVPGRAPLIAYLRADGSRVGELLEGKPKPGGKAGGVTSKDLGWTIAPVGKFPKQSVKVDPLDLIAVPRMVFAGYADGSNSVTNFVQSLKSSGYKLSVEERKAQASGRTIRNYRILGQKGTNKIEMVVDANLYLPVTINAESNDKQGKKRKLRWSTAWKNNVTFDMKEFQKVPKA